MKMNWGKLFGIEEEEQKPINIYESELFEEFLEARNYKETSKQTYRTYRDRLTEFIRDNGKKTLDQEMAIRFLENHKARTNVKQANYRWTFWNMYCEWLVGKGKLDVNPWKGIDLAALGISAEDVTFENKMRKAAKEKNVSNVSVDTSKKFSLSDVAELLLAIECNDEDAIISILTK